jgi:AhpD family alkylhydroperoxidase
MGNVSKKSDVYAEIKQTFGRIPEWIDGVPEAALSGFWSLEHDFYLAETRIPNKYKELIGIAVSGATRCKYCQLFHTEGARLNGATDEEIFEAAMMSGVTMMASTYLNAIGTDFDEFKQETREIVAYVKAQAKNTPSRSKGRDLRV